LQVKEPTFEGLSTVTVKVCAALDERDPEVWLTWHQLASVEAVQFIVALPVFVTVSDWPGGVEPPEIPVKLETVGESEIWEWATDAAVTV
jgi:hypothetical protein